MDRWANKVAVVTGAGSGIGAQFARDLCAHKVRVVGLDFNKTFLASLAAELPGGQFTGLFCDLTQEESIQAAFDRILRDFGGVDIMINCAGVFLDNLVLEADSHEAVLRTLQTNLVAPISCIRRAFQSMHSRDVEGHIVNVCSVAGHVISHVPNMKPQTAYYVSKSAVKVLNQMLNQELLHLRNHKVRVSNVSPGVVAGTNILKHTTYQEEVMDANRFVLRPRDISHALQFVLGAPANVQIREVIIESVGGGLY